MIVSLASAAVGWLFAFFLVIQHTKDQAATQALHERALDFERDRVADLTAQLQANAQGLQFYPSLPASEPEKEMRYLRDDTGLVEYQVDPDDDRDFADVAGL